MRLNRGYQLRVGGLCGHVLRRLDRLYCLTHTVVGGMTAGRLSNPVAAFLGGAISHAILDAVPHHDYKETVWGIFDLLLALGILFLARWQPELFPPAFIWGGLGGALPDLEWVLRHLSGKEISPIFPSHNRLTPHNPLAWPAGFWVQVVVMIAASGLWYFYIR